MRSRAQITLEMRAVEDERGFDDIEEEIAIRLPVLRSLRAHVVQVLELVGILWRIKRGEMLKAWLLLVDFDVEVVLDVYERIEPLDE